MTLSSSTPPPVQTGRPSGTSHSPWPRHLQMGEQVKNANLSQQHCKCNRRQLADHLEPAVPRQMR